MDELVVDGEKYISSKRAARLSGYAKDYIGQLCRNGKIDAKMVGRSWYVKESAIKEHRKTFQGEAVVDEKLWVEGKNGLEFQGFGAGIPAARPLLSEDHIKINYESDSRPLMPTLGKKEVPLHEEEKLFVAEAQAVPLRKKLEEDIIHYSVPETSEVVGTEHVDEIAPDESDLDVNPVSFKQFEEVDEVPSPRTIVPEGRRQHGYRLKFALVIFFVLVAILMLFESRSVYTATPQGFEKSESGIAILSIVGDFRTLLER